MRLRFFTLISIAIVQIVMVFMIKCSDTLNYNGTKMDYGSKLLFVLVFQISTLIVAFTISILDT